MTRRGKKYKKSKEELDLAKRYDFSEGVKLALECAYARFDESVDLAVRLGVDPRRADQMVRGTVVLPNGTGKSVRVLAFAMRRVRIMLAEMNSSPRYKGDGLILIKPWPPRT